MPISFPGAHVPKDMTRTGIGWYVANPLSTQNLGDMMLERHLRFDHSTMNRWVITYSPQLEATFSRRKRPVWSRWRLVETDQTGKGP
jgi:putative transposase